jgi:hypothetical protein
VKYNYVKKKDTGNKGRTREWDSHEGEGGNIQT